MITSDSLWKNFLLPLLVWEWSIVTKDAGKVDLSTISDYADSKPWRHTPLKE